MDKQNKGITINFAEEYADLICEDIPKLQLESYPYNNPIPEQYRKKFIHTEEGFAYLFCMSPEEQVEVRKTRRRALTNNDK